jgi:cell division protein FtsW
MGIALLLVIQALFNMLVAVGLAPVTGQPLPLISKGGTSTVINCIYIGVILSISRSAKKKEISDEPSFSPMQNQGKAESLITSLA